jgi:hypothetical protein
MRKLNQLITFLCFVIGSSVNAQNVNYYGLFPTIDHSADFSSRFSYNVYIFDAIKPYQNSINSITDEARSLYFYTEGGLSYAITKQLTFTASYVYERQNPFKDYYRNENRAFQQLTLKLPVGRFELKQRLRFDERFIQNKITGESPMTHRLRYLLGIKYPFKNEKMYFFAYIEAFFNTTPNASYLFNENWSAAQLGFKLNSWSNLETGLLYVGWINNVQKDWLNQFYLQITWASHFAFSKK